MTADEERDRLMARIERLEVQVDVLNAAVRELNGLLGNPLGVTDEDAEFGELRDPDEG